MVYFFVDDVVSQASHCGLHSSVVTPLDVRRQTAPPPLFIRQGLPSFPFGFCLDSSPCMGMWSCHDYFESFAIVVLCLLCKLKGCGGSKNKWSLQTEMNML